MDPYYAVKLELDDLIQELNQKLARYHGLQSKNPERRTLRAQIDAGCESAQLQLSLLVKAVDKASENPERFHLTSEELTSRRKWIENSRRQMESIREATQAAASAPPPPLPANATAAQIAESNAAFLDGEQHQQTMIMREQDRALDDIEAAVGRIGMMGRAIGEEMGDQERLLGDLQEDMDVTQTRLRITQKRMQEIIKKSGGTKQVCLIIFLVVVLLILSMIAFS